LRYNAALVPQIPGMRGQAVGTLASSMRGTCLTALLAVLPASTCALCQGPDPIKRCVGEQPADR
jgi:hypothetical protein